MPIVNRSTSSTPVSTTEINASSAQHDVVADTINNLTEPQMCRAHEFLSTDTFIASLQALRLLKKPDMGEAIVDAAQDRAATKGSSYALDQSPTSPYKNLSGNTNPESTKITWLENRYKCNQFVGDSLTQAGVKMPTYTMKDGTEHFMNAEALPKAKSHFDRVTNINDIKKGDLIVIDYNGSSGENGAHVGIVTDPKSLQMLSAKKAGTVAEPIPYKLDDTTYDASTKGWKTPNATVYILHPTKKLEP